MWGILLPMQTVHSFYCGCPRQASLDAGAAAGAAGWTAVAVPSALNGRPAMGSSKIEEVASTA